MASSVLNVKLGVCSVILNGVDLGHTIGGVEVTYSPEYHETKVDKYTGIAERFLIGEKLSAKVPLAEFVLDTIKAVIPHGTKTGTKLTIGSVAGKRQSTVATQLVLHPVENAANVRTDDVVLYKASNTGEITIGMKNDGEKIMEAMFEALVDESRTDGNFLGLIGDSTS